MWQYTDAATAAERQRDMLTVARAADSLRAPSPRTGRIQSIRRNSISVDVDN